MTAKDDSAASFAAFLEGLGSRDRQNIEKHLAACDADPDPTHGRAWRQMAAMLRRLAPMPVNTVGQQIAQFFIPDGKYRMQVFALEDKRDGTLVLYLPDVLELAMKKKVLAKPPAKRGKVAGTADDDDDDAPAGVQVVEYPIRESKGETLRVEALDAANTPDPPAHMRHMLGWNRKALRLTVPVGAPAQAAAAEAMCELAALSWAAKAGATPAGGAR